MGVYLSIVNFEAFRGSETGLSAHLHRNWRVCALFVVKFCLLTRETVKFFAPVKV